LHDRRRDPEKNQRAALICGRRLLWAAACGAALAAGASCGCMGQSNAAPQAPAGQTPQTQTPDAPEPQQGSKALAHTPGLKTQPCPAVRSGKPPAAQAVPKPADLDTDSDPAAAPVSTGTATPQCPPAVKNWYVRFTDGPQVKPLTPPEKAWLALRNVVDPFNILTILGDSGIAIGSNAHSPYGPGFAGFGKNVGISFMQDSTGEFFNTFLVPSITHQDPHYHRMPHASIRRRIGHAVLQVVWTQGDSGKPMVNYGNLVGSAIDDEISDLYVPARKTNLPASAERYGINLALAPTDNFVSEFLPDVASHIHVQVVIIQRIINQVAKTSDTP
jgi:hypothetical protein